MSKPADVLVAGGGGFIGGHLVGDLLSQGCSVRVGRRQAAVASGTRSTADAENVVADLSLLERAMAQTAGAGEVYMLAADMGGMGFIENNKALCMLTVLTNTHLLQAARSTASSASSTPPPPASTPPTSRPTPTSPPSRRTTPIRRMPEDGYGWEKLFTERMCRHFREDFGLTTRVARYHNVYGPHGTWDGGREKAPAAICRKVADRRDHRRPRHRDLGRRRADPLLHVHRRLRPRHAMILEGDISEPINLGSVGARLDQPAGRHRRGHRRHQAAPQLQARRPAGRARPQQATTR